MELRPLPLGEIFRRAATLYTRNFVLYASVTLAVTLPLSFVQETLDRIAVEPQLDQLLGALERPPAHGAALPNVAVSPSLFGAEALLGLLAYAGWTIAFAAIAAGIARSYAGKAVSFADCYGVVRQAWRGIAAVFALGVLVLLAWDLLQTVLALLFIALALSATRSLATAAPLAGFFVSMVMVFTFALLVVTLAFATYGVVVERQAAALSLREGFARVFGRPEAQRALLIGIAVCVTILAASLGVNVIAVAGAHSMWGAAVAVPQALVRAAVAPFPAVLLAAYYFDVLIRHEGYDVELGLARIEAGTASAEEAGYAPTAYLSGVERAVIKRFLERRDALGAARRAHLASRLAAPVRERVPPELRRLDDESLLERL